jgi:ribosome-binding protein aMBF1 (putative translation factor)
VTHHAHHGQRAGQPRRRDSAERIRERLPRRLQELREACGLSIYALWLKGGVSRDAINRIEGGETIPGVRVLARLTRGQRKL